MTADTPLYFRIVSRFLRPFPDFDFGFIKPVRARAVAALRLQPGDRALDLGCGPGGARRLLRGQDVARAIRVGAERRPAPPNGAPDLRLDPAPHRCPMDDRGAGAAGARRARVLHGLDVPRDRDVGSPGGVPGVERYWSTRRVTSTTPDARQPHHAAPDTALLHRLDEEPLDRPANADWLRVVVHVSHTEQELDRGAHTQRTLKPGTCRGLLQHLRHRMRREAKVAE